MARCPRQEAATAMAKPSNKAAEITPQIYDVDVADEMRDSFLEYAYSVIYSRALPDARDGLKPVQRRILYQMSQMGLRPDKGHVKSARVVGEVMGRLHPHGDGAIYDALVRMAQPFTLSLPFLDGHGNFGSVDDGPAAMRYTECRLAPAALAMTDSIDENTVEFMPNYDGREQEPQVLPAAFPALLVNGAAGIAVGMATSMAQHNLGETIAAAKLLLTKPKATLEQIMKVLPGPDFPSGGQIVGLDGIRDAYETGRGSFKMRASAAIEDVNPRRKGIVITALPYNVGPERVVEKLKELITSKKIEGIANVTDLTDYDHGLRLVIEIKSGYQPTAVLAKLYKTTPIEETFNVNNVALVNGQPKTLSLIELLKVFIDHRLEVVTRRSEHRRKLAKDRLHLVEGLLLAVLDIDEVIAVIRASDDTAAAKAKLMKVFDLSEIQTQYILEMPLRRLTKFSVIELETEKSELKAKIKELTAILNDPEKLKSAVAAELDEVASKHAVPRRTTILSDDDLPVSAEVESVEIPDQPCYVLYSQAGLLARTETDQISSGGTRVKYDAIAAQIETRSRAQIGLVTSEGRLLRLNVVDLPVTAKAGLASNIAASSLVSLKRGEQVVGITSLDPTSSLALATSNGVIKRLDLADLPNRDAIEIINLKVGDNVVGCGWIAADDEPLGVMITEDARLLQFELADIRAQGRNAAGVAGMKTSSKGKVIGFFIAYEDAEVITVAGAVDALPGTNHSSIKLTELAEFSITARGGSGVRCHKFRKGETNLVTAFVGTSPVVANTARGAAIELPKLSERDATGEKLTSQVTALGSLLS
jgi:DNA gyrase subunit A